MLSAISVLLDSIDFSAGNIPLENLCPSDRLADFISASAIDSEFDFFWTKTITVLSKQYQADWYAVEDLLIQLSQNNTVTVDDYLKLIMNFYQRMDERPSNGWGLMGVASRNAKSVIALRTLRQDTLVERITRMTRAQPG